MVAAEARGTGRRIRQPTNRLPHESARSSSRRSPGGLVWASPHSNRASCQLVVKHRKTFWITAARVNASADVPGHGLLCAALMPPQSQHQQTSVRTPPRRQRVTPHRSVAPLLGFDVHDFHCADFCDPVLSGTLQSR